MFPHRRENKYDACLCPATHRALYRPPSLNSTMITVPSLGVVAQSCRSLIPSPGYRTLHYVCRAGMDHIRAIDW
jgi:hypothetical protein